MIPGVDWLLTSTMHCMPLALIALLLPALPAMAQQRVVVVPAGAEIVIPPRGADGILTCVRM